MNPTTFPRKIKVTSEPVYLESFSLDNEKELWDFIQSDRSHPKRKGIWPGMDSFDALSTYMRSCDFKDPLSEEFGYIIRDMEGHLVGSFHIFSIDWTRDEAEVGFGLHHEHLGKGFATDALKLMEQTLRKIGFKLIKIVCQEGNRKSWAVAERAGFQFKRRFHKDKECSGCNDCTRVYGKVLNDGSGC